MPNSYSCEQKCGTLMARAFTLVTHTLSLHSRALTTQVLLLVIIPLERKRLSRASPLTRRETGRQLPSLPARSAPWPAVPTARRKAPSPREPPARRRPSVLLGRERRFPGEAVLYTPRGAALGERRVVPEKAEGVGGSVEDGMSAVSFFFNVSLMTTAKTQAGPLLSRFPAFSWRVMLVPRPSRRTRCAGTGAAKLTSSTPFPRNVCACANISP